MQGHTSLNINNLGIKRGVLFLWQAINVQVQPGQLLHIVGRNGSGKTSLLKTIAGILKADEGAIEYDATSLKNHCLYLGHENTLHPQLSILENLKYWATLFGGNLEDKELIDLLDLFNLKAYLHVPLKSLSAGQQRKITLLRLWFTPSRTIWLLDEPFTSLDKSSIALVNQRIAAHVKDKGMVVISAHHGVDESSDFYRCFDLDTQQQPNHLSHPSDGLSSC